MTPEPLKQRTMTLSQLQLRTLKVLRLVRKQFNRHPHEDGLSDAEFLDQIIDSFEFDIRADRAMIAQREGK